MSTSAISATGHTSQGQLGNTLKHALLGGVASAIGNFVVYGGAIAAGVSFTARFQGPQAPVSSLPVPMIAVSSIVPALIAGLVFFGLSKLTKAHRTVFVVLSGLLAVASMGGPANLGDASGGARIALGLMHLVAAAGITVALLRGTRAQS